MAGLVPAIHVFDVARPQDVDARHKAGHDGREAVPLSHNRKLGILPVSDQHAAWIVCDAEFRFDGRDH